MVQAQPMMLLPVEEIKIDKSRIAELDEVVQSTFRLITFSRAHLADDLLNSFLASTADLQELLSIKNAQMEAQSEEEAEQYVKDLNNTLAYIISEIKHQVPFESEVQLFQLFRLISADAHAGHPNRYRSSSVQIGGFICPDSSLIPSLVSQLFNNISQIENPVTRAIYFHHELIRIHPFADGNGRTIRMAKNWMLMYHLYPPIFIRDEQEKQQYINALGLSFYALDKNPGSWNDHLDDFFHQELDRLISNARIINNAVCKLGQARNA